ncbi:mucin-5AC [Mugil cephalus]|uniref:mucin-5AC n=1 Tax=Mugil cephalus TaxID=48193 RepID=UPI001FB67705|nr:mucin-5AC [Mugil cephalus]
MAVAYSTQQGLLAQQYPPPLLPKPGKDNVRLQKLLKRTAKKKASAQASQSATPFRSSLSPVNEASPDLEHSDHSTPPRTPETPSSLYRIKQPQRFTVRPLYQHVASPYPQRAAYGRAANMSPQTVGIPLYPYSQSVTTVSTYSASAQYPGVPTAPEQAAQSAIPKTSLPALSVPEVTVPASELKKPAFNTFSETHTGQRSAVMATAPQSKPISPGPTPYPIAGSQAVIRPLTVLTPLVKSKSPRPTFKATEPSRSPKPMFDVPQIRMYTASTSYYETSRTPPVYDSAGLTAIGSTVSQNKTSAETKNDLTIGSEVRSIHLLGVEPQRKTPTSDIKRDTTPTAEINAVSTSEIKRATPTAEIKRATPTAEIKRATPTAEIKRATPTAEIKRATPTSEIKRATPTSEIKRATPTSEIRAKTPTYEFQISRTSAGRPKTPAYHLIRATTPVFEISRPNPLLFAVSPITVDADRSRTTQTVSTVTSSSISEGVKTTSETMPQLNGDIQSDVTPAAKPIQQSITKSKSEPDLTKEITPTIIPTTKTVISVPTSPAVTGYQRPRTPTYEASRLMTTSPGYKRPKTPTYGTSTYGASSVTIQRPKTPTQVSQQSKSTYRGLTPAEYVAHGGIKTYSPAFGIVTSMMPTQEEVQSTVEVSGECKIPSQEPCLKGQSIAEESKLKASPKDVHKLPQKEEKLATIPLIPVIVVSQASDSLATMVTQESNAVSGQVAAKQEKPKPPTVEEKRLEKQKVETPVQETKPKTKTSETRGPLPTSGDQDPLKAVKKLLGKDKLQPADQKATVETKADVSKQKEPVTTTTATKMKLESSKPSSAVPAPLVKVPAAKSVSEDKRKDKKAESAPAVKASLEKREVDETLPSAEPVLKAIQKPKGMKLKASGWSRLKKHMVVEQEEPKFPEADSQEASGQQHTEVTKVDEKAGDKPSEQDENKDAPKATKMWDAVLFQMFSSKENIMHQIELNKSEEEKKEEKQEELKEIPSFAYRLPVLLFSPKFDAKRLKEAASRPVTKISTVFEMGLIGRKGKDEEPKDFNRTARGFTGV